MTSNKAVAAAKHGTTLPTNLIAGLLGFFYPIHYGISMEVEARMCQGKVSRQQAAVVWLLESSVGGNGWMRRREIEQYLRTWFETSNPQVSQLLKSLANPPFAFIRQIENPTSAREKLVALTPQGQAFYRQMFDIGMEFLSTRLAHISEDMARSGISFYSAITYRPPGLDEDSETVVPKKKAPAKRHRMRG